MSNPLLATLREQVENLRRNPLAAASGALPAVEALAQLLADFDERLAALENQLQTLTTASMLTAEITSELVAWLSAHEVPNVDLQNGGPHA
jgi:hypothetical protein